ncbi:Bromo_TP domain-containing protein/TAF8_C domain-containing protein [Cinnamomum micranthum f. kanehirae]|uniref:Bromo_TP domain-containing protein/TAF8_C domain-containing protein n=1 Tax=Cinnamomum micranthum f. kanehirae TaxID=337451 RepID=A0A443P4P5_9MAGN|nr:Bromo_TP domain-containing protein/TAF8_C domain-containing protein [Cinnamomum micranthum f. kanehirae]
MNSDSSPSLHSSISKIAVAQICHSIGFHSTEPFALESLSQIATLYLQTLARSASSFANSSNRTQSNLLDLILALEHLASLRGFPGASRICKPLLQSGTLRDIVNFVESIDELPFASQIPRSRPMTASPSSLPPPSFADLGKDPPFPHIPAWLPAFPNLIRRRDEDEDERVRAFGDGEGLEGNSVVVEKGERVLPAERPRVRFRFGLGFGFEGMGTRSGVCRGGKRVCWRRSDEEERLNGEGCGRERLCCGGFQRSVYLIWVNGTQPFGVILFISFLFGSLEPQTPASLALFPVRDLAEFWE